jgi:hypothetical protein
MLNTIPTGLMRLSSVHRDISSKDEIRSTSFRVELIAPMGFQFDPSLPHSATTCPSTVSH